MKQNQKKIIRGFGLLVLVGALFGIGHLAAGPYDSTPVEYRSDSNKCFIFVHGHWDWRGKSDSTAATYWSGQSGSTIYSMVGTIPGWAHHGPIDRWYTFNWDSHKYYWDASKEVSREVAEDIRNCRNNGKTNITIIAHSMGNVVMDFILGNGTSSDAYHHYGNTSSSTYLNNYFKYIRTYATRMVGIAGPHNGSQAADQVCGSGSLSGWVLGNLYTSCDNGFKSLQSSSAWRVWRYMNDSATPVYLIAGWRKLPGASSVTSSYLSGTDDGLVNYMSAFFCPYTGNVGMGVDSQCSTHWQEGYYNCDQSNEDHDHLRNGVRFSERRSVSNGYCWYNSNGRITSPNYQMRTSMSVAEFIRCKWGSEPGSYCN